MYLIVFSDVIAKYFSLEKGRHGGGWVIKDKTKYESNNNTNWKYRMKKVCRQNLCNDKKYTVLL